jgi:hypothetical protein
LVLVSLPHTWPELPPGEGGDLLKESVVLVDEALVGGMAKAQRARHLKGLRRDQEITPLADERFQASTALPPVALNVRHKERLERGTSSCQGGEARGASSTGAAGERS